ncbi:Glutaredoxin-C4 [Frankliniella fusca]|uniref:Glutaredoxin-2, mitochondrial n=1 Tax=Frankliniella fusca TaxID=407009 RepID=A0AAE1L9Y4_9NEOP|nr:Glutaredoxin-C4 [Frankliniella fusca]
MFCPRVPKKKGPVEPVDMNGELAQSVKKMISDDKVVIFSKTYCPYCTMAKEVFNKINFKYTAIELDKRDDGDQIQAILGEMTGATTVPRVFLDGECIGGGTDVKALHESGELSKKLNLA